MTVSNMFYDLKIVRADINYENVKNKKDCPYDIEERGFKDLIQSMALCTKASFFYQPSSEEILSYWAKKKGVNIKKLEAY